MSRALEPIDLATDELEMNGSIYEGFAAAIMVKGEPRTVALCREYGDAVQLMAVIERDRRTLDLIIRMHVEGVLSEGQVQAATGLDRVDIRRLADSLGSGSGGYEPKANAPTPSVNTELLEALDDQVFRELTKCMGVGRARQVLKSAIAEIAKATGDT